MRHWLLKSEPSEWSWTQQVAKGSEGEPWSGVRNFQAQRYMREMQVGDLGFFYHSGRRREIVGVVKIIQPFQLDGSDESGRFGLVWVEAVHPLLNPVSLAQIKAEANLSDMLLVRQSRLSVMPVTDTEWNQILRMSQGDSESGA